MFKPAPIDNHFVPYTKRSRGKFNAPLFVDGGRGRRRAEARAAPQAASFEDPCPHGQACKPCIGRPGWCTSDAEGRLCQTRPSPDCRGW